MQVNTIENNGAIVLEFHGRLDTTTAPEGEKLAVSAIEKSKDVTFDFTDLEYLSSAGLRVILGAHKKLKAAGGRLTVAHPNDVVMKVFDITGFSDIINIA